jgi:hypothetical protein
MLALKTIRIIAAKMPSYFVRALLIPFRFATIPLLARDALPSRFYAASASTSAARQKGYKQRCAKSDYLLVDRENM